MNSENQKQALFHKLFEEYQDAIFRFVFFRVGNRQTALDITQDTFVRLWGYLAKGGEIEHEQAFVYRIAKNAVIDYYKKSKSSSLEDLLDVGFEPETNSHSEEILRNDDIKMVQGLLEELDEESRQIIFLRYSEEKPIEEIAKLFGKTPNAMTVRIHRIVQKLKVLFSETHYD
ncbi:MAG TPA: sigma-70 family RNA polymerase sigma factor [Candidatus Paceibacterota bacterium]|nr:sigma-70 family RNA polymerase sigma factor [Candidatus Paceibacterota bacterium]